MEKVYDLHQHSYCVFMHIGKTDITTYICSSSNRIFSFSYANKLQLGSSISYNRDRTDVMALGKDCEEEAEDNTVIENFYDRLYNLFKKKKANWDEEDIFLMKAVSDYLPLAVKNTMEKNELEIESFDLFHYAFIVPSEWEEEMREDIIRPIFVQSGLISNEDHQDRLLFFSDIESVCYGLQYDAFENCFLKKGQNTILCRLSPDKGKIVIKFDLIQTTNTLFNVSNAKLFPKVMKSSLVSVTADDIESCKKDFLRTNLFPMAADDGGVRKSQKSELVPVDQDQIIEEIIEMMNSQRFDPLDEESEEEESEEDMKTEPWITYKKSWMLSEIQKEFIQSLCPSTLCTGMGTALFGDMKYIIPNNSTKSYGFLLFEDIYSNQGNRSKNTVKWLNYILECNIRSLNYVKINPDQEDIGPDFLLSGAGLVVCEAIQHSDIYCKPRIMPSEDLNISSSVFLNSEPGAIIDLDISLGSTLFTYLLLDEDGSVRKVFNHDDFIADKYLPPLGHFFSFSKTITLNVKKQFITFAERYLLGDLADLTVDEGVFIKKDLSFEMKAILTKQLLTGEVLVSINKPKYFDAFILMYMAYIKKEILNKLPGQQTFDYMDTKIGYAVSIESMLLYNTIGTKDNFRDLIYASGLVPKDNNSKKLRITIQGERILPAIQKSLRLELPPRSYFLLCQLHEDYVQLSLHQVVTASTSEEKEQESITVQDEIMFIPNIYDSLSASMWRNLVQDSSLIELCEMHNTSDKSKILDIFSLKLKKEFFANFNSHIFDNVLQNNPGAQKTTETNAVKLNNSCNCKVRLTTADIIDISFTPVLQDIACTLSASLLNKKIFGNYTNIDYLFSFIQFNNNPQLQYAFARILEEEAVGYNLELGIDTCCLLVPELFSQLIRPVIAQQPLCYKDFKIGALQQVSSENYAFSICPTVSKRKEDFIYKIKRTDTKTNECGKNIGFPLLNKGERMNNALSSRTFYLRSKKDSLFTLFCIHMITFKTMNYLENNETLGCDDIIHQYFGNEWIRFGNEFKNRDVDVPVMFSISYISYTSSLRFLLKIVGVDTRDEYLAIVMESSEPLTLIRF